MREYLEIIQIGLLIFLIYQLGRILQVLTKYFAPEKSDIPFGGQTVNINIDRDGNIKDRDNERDKESLPDGPLEEESETTAPEESQTVDEEELEEEVEEETEKDPGAPSEEALLRAREREEMAEQLKQRNKQRELESQRHSKASDSSTSALDVSKCEDCGAENSSMRENCFNCGKKL